MVWGAEEIQFSGLDHLRIRHVPGHEFRALLAFTLLIIHSISHNELCRQLRWLCRPSSSYPQLALWARRISPASLAYAVRALGSPKPKPVSRARARLTDVACYVYALVRITATGASSPRRLLLPEYLRQRQPSRS